MQGRSKRDQVEKQLDHIDKELEKDPENAELLKRKMELETEYDALRWHDKPAEEEALIENKFNFMTPQDLLNLPEEKNNWFVEGYIPEEAFCVLAAKRASWKTWASLEMALSVATGTLFCGTYPTKKGKVLYIDEENGPQELRKRLMKIATGKGIDLGKVENLKVLSWESFRIDKEEDKAEIEDWLRKNSPALVIIDAFKRVVSIEENDATAMNEVIMEHLRPLIKETGCTLLLLHHLRKGISGSKPDDIMDEIRGSSEITNYSDIVLVNQRKEEDGEDMFVLLQAKNRKAKELDPQLIRINWDDAGNPQFISQGAYSEVAESAICASALAKWMAEDGRHEFATKDILDRGRELGYSQRTCQRALYTDLKGGGKLYVIKRGIWSLFPPFRHNRQADLRQYGGNSIGEGMVRKSPPSKGGVSAIPPILYSSGGKAQIGLTTVKLTKTSATLTRHFPPKYQKARAGDVIHVSAKLAKVIVEMGCGEVLT